MRFVLINYFNTIVDLCNMYKNEHAIFQLSVQIVLYECFDSL